MLLQSSIRSDLNLTCTQTSHETLLIFVYLKRHTCLPPAPRPSILEEPQSILCCFAVQLVLFRSSRRKIESLFFKRNLSTRSVMTFYSAFYFSSQRFQSSWEQLPLAQVHVVSAIKSRPVSRLSVSLSSSATKPGYLHRSHNCTCPHPLHIYYL